MENAEKVFSENRVVVRVPGTSANCGSGFDCLGLAVTIYNDLDLTLLEDERLIIESTGEGAESVPTDEKNIVWKSARMVLERANLAKKFKMPLKRLTKMKIPAHEKIIQILKMNAKIIGKK